MSHKTRRQGKGGGKGSGAVLSRRGDTVAGRWVTCTALFLGEGVHTHIDYKELA